MKAYSLDLREKIIEAYSNGKGSQRKLAETFGVTRSFIQKLFKRYREEGSIAAKVRTQQTPTKLSASELEVLREVVESQPDATLAELCEQLYERTGTRISVATMDRMVRLKLGLSFKKKVSTPPRKGARMSS
jgi:transposase